MSTWFLKCICAFNRVLSCLRRTGESGVLGERWGLLGSCGYWQVVPLHQTGPGEVPMTCFIPTLVLCRKKWRGKSSHNSSICLKRLENKKKSPTVARPCECFCAAVSDREGKCAGKKILFVFTLSSDWCPGSGKILLVLTEERKPRNPFCLLDGNSLLSPLFEYCNWTLRGSQREVWCSVTTAHKSYISHLCVGSNPGPGIPRLHRSYHYCDLNSHGTVLN